MSIKLRPPESQLLRLVEIAKIGGARLTALANHFDEINDPPLQPLRLANEARTILSEEEAEPTISQLLSLHSLTRKANLSELEVVQAIIDALRSHKDLDHNQWEGLTDVMVRLIGSKAVRITATAIDLSYDYANLVRQARILSDIRPLYDESGRNIEAAVVSHTLRLHYDSTDSNHELSLVLDSKDIRDLILQCERALIKADTAKSLLQSKACIPTVISGESSEDDE